MTAPLEQFIFTFTQGSLRPGDCALVIHGASVGHAVDTRAGIVVEITVTGSIILADGRKFQANGAPYSCNSEMRLVDDVIYRHNDPRINPAWRDVLLQAWKAENAIALNS